MTRASTMMTERELRRTFEDRAHKDAMTGADLFGRGGKPTAAYLEWLERIIRGHWPALSRMMDDDTRREKVERTRVRNRQATIYEAVRPA